MPCRAMDMVAAMVAAMVGAIGAIQAMPCAVPALALRYGAMPTTARQPVCGATRGLQCGTSEGRCHAGCCHDASPDACRCLAAFLGAR
jgi:hypothetical protein